jgi:Flp pilus assembly protein TadG
VTTRQILSARNIKKRLRDDRGQSLVEFALSALVLLMLVFGVIEIGRMVLLYTTVSHAARIGTRYAIVHGSDASSPSGPTSDDTTVIGVVKNFAGVGGLDTSNLTVHVNYYSSGGVSPSCNAPGCWVKVTASYPYDPLISYFPISVTLGSSSEGVITF